MTLAVFILYMLAMMAMGGYFYRKTRSGSDFALGGKTLRGPIAGMSVAATGSSGWVLLGVAGFAYRTGFPHVFWISLFATLGGMVGWIVIARRLRAMANQRGDLTVPDVLESHFGGGKFRVIRWLSLLVIVVTMVVYVGSLLLQSTTALGALFGWKAILSVLVTAVFVAVYVSLGGFLAVAYTDFIQGLMMVVGAIVAAIYALTKVGGFGGLIQGLAGIDPKFTSLSLPFLTIVGYSSTSILAYMAVPQIVIRYMAIKDVRQVRPAVIWGGVAIALLYFGTLIAGSSGRLIYPDIKNPETVLVLMFKDIGPLWAGIFIASMMCAIMSTVDSVLHVGATTIIRDIIQKIINPLVDERKLLWTARVVIVVLTLVGIYIALNPFAGILWITWWAWAGLTAFGGPILMAVFWKRATKAGCIAGLLTGFVASILWQTSAVLKGYLHPCFIAYVGGLIAVVIVSPITSPAPELKKQVGS